MWHRSDGVQVYLLSFRNHDLGGLRTAVQRLLGA